MDLAAKKQEINLVLSEPDVDLWRLRELCLTEGGLVDDTLRKRAWPKLVGLHGAESVEKLQSSSARAGRSRIPRPPDPPGASGTLSAQAYDTVEPSSSSERNGRIAECADADQIDRDVARCTWHLLTGSQRSRRLQMENKHRKKVANLIKRKQRRLGNLINFTLVHCNTNADEEDQLRYYQGFHDVACVFLSTLGGGGYGPTPPPANASSVEVLAASMGLDLPSRVLGQVSKSHLRDAMRSNFIQLQVALRLILFPLLAKFDPEVHAHLYYCDMEPFFALSWVITWFSHDIRDTAMVKRLFDAFIVSHPLFPFYLSVAMILHPFNRTEILNTDCDFASVHQVLAGLPKNSSMVGWKFKVADGYTSGDGTDEGSTASTDMDSTFLADELLDLIDDEANETQSLVSSNLSVVGSNQAPVPFQELIDTALLYMRRVPPRRLMGLAKWYYVEDPNQAFMFEHAKSISLLQHPPSWALAATTPADWVLKQRLRESRGMKAKSRRDRRIANRSRSRSRSEAGGRPGDVNNYEEIEKYLEEKQKTLAVIACGFGPGDDDEERRKKRRKLLVWGAVAVALVAVSYALVAQYRPSTRPLEGSPMGSSESIERDLVGADSAKASEHDAGHSPTTTGGSWEDHSPRVSEEIGAGRKERAEFVVSPRGNVESMPRTEAVKLSGVTSRAASSDVIKAPETKVTMTSLTAELAGESSISRDWAVPILPVRLLKDLFVRSRQLANDVDKLMESVYCDVRRAFEERDLHHMPGSRLVYSFVSNARLLLGKDGEGARLAQDTVSNARRVFTPGKIDDIVRNTRRFIVSNARAALTENEAEVVVL